MHPIGNLAEFTLAESEFAAGSEVLRDRAMTLAAIGDLVANLAGIPPQESVLSGLTHQLETADHERRQHFATNLGAISAFLKIGLEGLQLAREESNVNPAAAQALHDEFQTAFNAALAALMS